MVQRKEENESKQQHMNGTENILLKSSAAEGVRNYNREALQRRHMEFLTFWKIRIYFDTATMQLEIFEIPQCKEFHAVLLSGLHDDFQS